MGCGVNVDKVSTITGIGVPLRRTNVDTDQIIPAEFRKRVTKTGFEDALFERWRKDPSSSSTRNRFHTARCSSLEWDFGTGSSREHAVWALRDFGFRAVIAPRFGDLFRGNSGKQGLLTRGCPRGGCRANLVST